MDAISIYIHIPFCEKRCSYCDFNTYAGIDHLIPAYVSALRHEILQYGVYFGEKVPVRTLFFGGGTPSLLTANHYEMLFEELNDAFDLSAANEISLEANPGTVNFAYLRQLREIGFNRISFGVQSAHQDELKLLGRIHSFQQALDAIEWAQHAGFDNYNVDLIYGLPNQSAEKWMESLQAVTVMQPAHLSMYALGVEEGTPLFDWVAKGQIPKPDDDLSAEMYEMGVDFLAGKSYSLYEISNLYRIDPKTDFRCQHNLQYWRNLPYVGMGAGAHGSLHNHRTENWMSVPVYLKKVKPILIDSGKWSDAIVKLNPIDRYTEMQETMMVGLRLIDEGISISAFTSRFDVSPLTVFQKEVDILLQKKLIEIVNAETIRIRRDRIMISNQVFQYFV